MSTTVTPTPTVAPQVVSSFEGSGNDADTYGWDTTFAINFRNANAAISASWDQVDDKAKNLSQAASDDPSYHIDSVLGPWQLTEGGDGKNVRMICPIASGSYTAGNKVYDLSGKGVQVVIEVGMEWVPNPGQKSFVTSGNTEVDSLKASLDQNQISDQLRTEFSNHGMALSDKATALVLQSGKEWGVTDDSNSYYIFWEADKDNNEFLYVYQYQKAWANNLKLLAQAVSDSQPAVVIITIVNNPATGIAAAVLPDLLSLWFNTNIAEFNHFFASLDLSPIVSTSDKYAWMKPTATSYAVVDEGSLDTSIFGVLTMALNHVPGDNHQVSPYAIPTAAGADAGFLISGPMFMQNMLLAGAQSIFNNAPASSFLLTNDGLTVQNTQDMVWGKFMMDNKSQGSVSVSNYPAELDNKTLSQSLQNALQNIGVNVFGNYGVEVTAQGSQWLLSTGHTDDGEYILNLSDDHKSIGVWLATAVTIAKGQFKMSLVHTYVEIEFIDLYYSYSSDFDVHVNYTEQVQLSLKQESGKQIFWFDQIMKDLTVNVTKTKSAITREIVEGAVMAAISLVAIAGPIIEGLQAGSQIVKVTDEVGEAVVGADAFRAAAEANPEAEAANEVNAAANAADQAGGKLTAIKNAFSTPKWKFVGALAALAGAIAGLDQTIDAIIEAAAKNQWEDVPGFDDFANQAIVPYTFPNVAGFSLASSGLAGSLQIGLKVNPAS